MEDPKYISTETYGSWKDGIYTPKVYTTEMTQDQLVQSIVDKF